MTVCRQELINSGSDAIPRSCPTCKFEPCSKGLTDYRPPISNGSSRRLAAEILALKWVEMDSFTQAIITALEADNGDDNSPRFLAFHLTEWAKENAPQ